MMSQELIIIEDTNLEDRFNLVNYLRSGCDSLGEYYKRAQGMASVDYYLNMVTKITGVSKTDLKSKSRKRKIVIARRLYIALAYKLTTQSTVEIAHAVCKDHALVHHSIKTLIDDYNDWREEYKFTVVWIKKASVLTGLSVSEILSESNGRRYYGA